MKNRDRSNQPRKDRPWLSRLAHALTGLAMLAGAVWAAAQPESSLRGFLLILGALSLLYGLTGLIAYFRLSEKPTLKERAGLALSVLVMLLGALMLLAPGFVAPALRIAAAAAFAVMGLRGLLRRRGQGAGRALQRFLIAASLLQIALAALMIVRPLPETLTLALLITLALLLSGAEQLALAFRGAKD